MFSRLGITDFRPRTVPECDISPGESSKLFDKLLEERQNSFQGVGLQAIANANMLNVSAQRGENLNGKTSKKLNLPYKPLQELTIGGINPDKPDEIDLSMRGGFDISPLCGPGATMGFFDPNGEDLELEHVNQMMGYTLGWERIDGVGQYSGDYLDDQPHGKGRMFFDSDDVYEGEFYEGKIQGYGRIEFQNGDYYEGEFSGGQINGIGRLELRNGLSFEGQFTDGIPQVIEDYFADYAKELKAAKKAQDVSTRLFAIQESMRLTVCQKAISALKLSFEANRQSLIESKLTEEQRQARELKKKKEIENAEKERLSLIQSLIDEEEKEKKVKNLNLKGKKGTKTHHSSSGSSSFSSKELETAVQESLAITSVASSKVLDPITTNCAKKFSIHVRVGRWKTKTFDEIRAFTDYRDGTAIQPYNHMTDAELKIQRMEHHLPGLECILGQGNKGVYWNPTERGARIMGALVQGDQEIAWGDVCFGIDEKKKTIFHKKFTKWPGTKTDYRRLSAPAAPLSENSSAEKGWETAGSCTWEILAGRIIEFTFFDQANKKPEPYKIRIYTQD